MNNRRSTFIPGLILISVGVWLLLRNLNVPIAGLDVLWPIFPTALGLAFLLQYLLGGRQAQDSGLVFTGVAAALTGGFFFLFTLERLRWGDLDRYWPVFVLIGSVAFLAQWIANPTQRGLLVPGALALLVGAVALASTQGLINPEVVRQITKLWPLLLIVMGIGVIANYMLKGKQ